MRKQTRILILILVFTMFMAISASLTRVWIDEVTPKAGPIFEIENHESLSSTQPAEANRNLVRLQEPVLGDSVSSPLRLEGEARGYWYFEATAPAKLLDANGNEISRGYVTAQDEWMTDEFVPFEGELLFDRPDTTTGTLILMNANASGDPERDIFLHIPVRFE